MLRMFDYSIFIVIMIIISGCKVGGSGQSGNLCSSTTLGGQCKTSLDMLIPGQSNVGKYVIEMENGNLDKYIEKCKNGTLEDDLWKRGSDYANPDFGGNHGVVSPLGITGVVTPDGKIMLINGHHHTYALHLLQELVADQKVADCDYDGHVYVYIVDNYYNQKYQQRPDAIETAYNYMIDRLSFESRVWLKDSSYQKISYKQLPRSFREMGDDKYRSLIKLVSEHKCNKGSKKDPDFKYQQLINGDSIQPFLEFSWGEQLRALTLRDFGYDIYQNLPYDYNPQTGSCLTVTGKKGKCKDVAKSLTKEAYNYINLHYEEFYGLPGYNYASINRDYICE